MKQDAFLLIILMSLLSACSSGQPRFVKDRDEVAAHKVLMQLSADDLKQQVDEYSAMESSWELHFSPEEMELIEYADNLGRYQVQNGDSLKLVAFRIYGDMDRWKELFNLNKDLLDANDGLGNVSNLRYVYPEHEFEWEVVGEPYLILADDTPAIIAQKIYADSKRWPEIYQNNSHLLKDPKVIYPGFTIYYVPDTKPAK